MSKNILVVDDSALMRKVVSDIINSDGRFDVVETATNGLEAIKILIKEEGKYDAMILDINMDTMDGLEVLDEIKRLHIDIKVVVLSTLAVEGGGVTIEALTRGAFDFVTKPCAVAEMEQSLFKEKLIKCLLIATDSGISNRNMKKKGKDIKKKTHIVDDKKRKLVFVALSTGGPNALHKVIPKLNKNIDAPIVVVQHMPDGFTQSLAKRLNELSKINVKETETGDKLEKGTVYIAKGGSQLLLEERQNEVYCKVCKMQGEVLNPCANITLKSIKDLPYDEIICVVLTGMGSDGTKGIVELNKKKDIYVIAQNEASCVVYGMPKMIVASGLANEVVPLNDIAKAIIDNTGVR